MKRIYKLILLIPLLMVSSFAFGQTPYVYYDFEDNSARTTTGENTVEFNSTLATPANINKSGGNTTISYVTGNGAGMAAAYSDWGANGTSDPGIGASNYLEFAVNSSAFKGLLLKGDFAASSTNISNMNILYSTDGGSSWNAATAVSISSSYVTKSFDLSAITALDDNASTIFRIYAWGNSSLSSSDQLKVDNLFLSSKTLVGDLTLDNYAKITNAGASANTAALTINGSGITVTLSSDMTFTTSLTVTNGNLNAGGNVLHAANAGVTFSISGTLITGNAGGLSGANNTTIDNTNSPTLILATNSTVDYNSSDAQNITAVNYYNLITEDVGDRILASSGTIGIAGTFTPGPGNFFDPTTSTVSFNGSSIQTVPSFDFYNLNVVNAHNYTQGGDITIEGGGTLTVSSGATFVAGSNQIFQTGSGTANVIINGKFQTTNAGGFSGAASGSILTSNLSITVGSASTVEYNKTGAQTISPFNYANLSISGNRNFNNITLASGTIGVSGTLSITATKVTSYITTGSTVDFNGSGAQSIPVAFNYDGLSISNGGNKSLAGSVSVTATLTLNAGALVIGNNTLTINGGGISVSAGTLTGGSNSNMTFSGTGTTTTLPTVSIKNLIMNRTNAISLGGALTITGTLTLTNGKIQLSSSDLTMAVASSISGASASSYIVTNGTGRLKMSVGLSSVVFPIGAATYLPLTLVSNSGTIVYTVGVIDGITGNDGITQIVTHSVNETWDITAASSTSGADITLQWNGTNELTGFNRTTSYILSRTAIPGGWSAAQSAGAATGSNPYTRAITSMSLNAGTKTYLGISDNVSPLPVTLISFEAVLRNNEVISSWTTASEINNMGFNLERSVDGLSWQTLGFVEGHGTTNYLYNYHFTDQNLPLNTNVVYYRLKQIDFNAAFAYSSIRSIHFDVNKPEGNMQLTAFPNPVTGNLNITGTNIAPGESKMVVSNMNGVLINQETIQNTGSNIFTQTLDANTWKSGNYVICITSGGQVKTTMVVKQ